MKTKLAILIAPVFVIFSSLAYGGDYSCHANSNPDRGFSTAFDVQLTPAEAGGRIALTAHGRQITLGTISEVKTISSGDPAFNLTLQFIGEPDVSGIAANNLSSVTSVVAYKAKATDGDETIIFRLFSGQTQIGGTFLTSGLGTACLTR